VVKCMVCGKVEDAVAFKTGKWLGSESGKVVCSENCRDEYDASHPGLIHYSRITGYLSPVNSWNAGKKAELADRVKYNRSF
jgi:anaerobic ribonucleoside-triphosphate reductase